MAQIVRLTGNLLNNQMNRIGGVCLGSSNDYKTGGVAKVSQLFFWETVACSTLYMEGDEVTSLGSIA